MGVTSCAQVFREPNREVPEVLINIYAFPKVYIKLKEIKQHSLTQTKGDITGKLPTKKQIFHTTHRLAVDSFPPAALHMHCRI